MMALTVLALLCVAQAARAAAAPGCCRRGRPRAGLRREADGVAGGAAGAGAVRAARRCPGSLAAARRAAARCAARCTSWSRWRGCSGRSPSPPPNGRSPSARATAARGTRRSCSTASTASRASRARARAREPPIRPALPHPRDYARLTQSQREDIPLRRPSAGAPARPRRPAVRRRLGLLVLAALLLGLPALACELLRAPPATERRDDARPQARSPGTARRRRLCGRSRGTGAVDGDRHGPVQPDGAPASALHRELHARRGGDARDRARVGLRAAHSRAPAARSRSA